MIDNIANPTEDLLKARRSGLIASATNRNYPNSGGSRSTQNPQPTATPAPAPAPQATTETPTTPLPVPQTTTKTTDNQDWAKGELEVTDEGVFFTPPASTVKPADTVEARLGGLLTSGSPYLESAKSRAQQEANARGLLNSTMAATAGEKAAIEAALPIATQDASYYQELERQKQQAGLQSGLYEKQGEISSKLSAQTHTQEMAKQAAEIEWNKIDLQARMDVETARLDAENKKMFNDTVNAISTEYMTDYTEIMANPAFDGYQRQAAIDILSENTKQRYRLAGEIANVELTWQVPTEGKSVATGPPTATTTTTAAPPPATTIYPPAFGGEGAGAMGGISGGGEGAGAGIGV